MNLEQYITRRHTYLVSVAARYCNSPQDVVHDTYLKAMEANFIYINDRLTEVYFVRSIKRNAQRVKDHHLPLTVDVAEEIDTSKIISREKIDEAVRLLPEFDRLLFEQYARGVNMTQLSRQSGISLNTIYHSLKRSRDAIKDRI